MYKSKVMKKIISVVLALTCVFAVGLWFVKPAFAAGMSISPGAWTVTQGGSVYVSVTITSNLEIYAYDIYISGGGALSGGDSFAAGGTGGHSVTVGTTLYAEGSGTGTISASGNVSDGDSSESAGGSVAITVNAVPSGGGNSGGGTGGGANYGDDYSDGNGNYINNNPTGQGSGNVALASLKVIGPDKKEITLKDEGNSIYSATVLNSIDKVTIEAAAADAKASVSGAGEKTLKVGENAIDVVVTAENGLQKGYRINITRKDDKIALTDLEAEMKASKADYLTVKLADGDVLDAKLLKAVKEWGKLLVLNKYAEDDSVIYSWLMKGANIEDDMTKFDPAVTFESKNAEKIDVLSNFAKGKIINLAHSGKLPAETVLVINNKEEFKEGAALNLYYYDEANQALTLQEQEITAGAENVIISLDHASEYFLTRSTIPIMEEENKQEGFTLDLKTWIMLAEAVVILGLLIALIAVLAKKKKNKNTTPDPQEPEENLPKEPDEELANDILKDIPEMYGVSDLSENVIETMKESAPDASDLSETTILRNVDLDNPPETETTIIKFEDIEKQLHDE